MVVFANITRAEYLDRGLDRVIPWGRDLFQANKFFDITTDRVSLISIHSAKGLDFDLVYLVGADRIIPMGETRERLIRLLYVPIPRPNTGW